MAAGPVKGGHWRLPVVRSSTTPPVTGAFERRELPPRPGKLEKALRELWTPSIRRRLMLPKHWKDQFFLRRHYDMVELDAGEVQLDFPIGRLPDCDLCEDVCCTGLSRVVLLRLVDVAALVDAGLQDQFTHDKPTYPAREIQENAALFDIVSSEAWRTMPVLKQDATRTCSMLTAENRCGAWPAWPLSCARFPYSLDILRGRIFYAKACNSVQQDATRAGRLRERALVDAVVDAYNQRLRDAVLMRVARPELQDLGLGAHVRWP
jgi:hypothetical protein